MVAGATTCSDSGAGASAATPARASSRPSPTPPGATFVTSCVLILVLSSRPAADRSAGDAAPLPIRAAAAQPRATSGPTHRRCFAAVASQRLLRHRNHERHLAAVKLVLDAPLGVTEGEPPGWAVAPLANRGDLDVETQHGGQAGKR
jgi:hypothetical protein